MALGRLVKSPKGYFVDTILLCHLLQYNIDDLYVNRPDVFGHVMENFVASELLKLIANNGKDMSLYQGRDCPIWQKFMGDSCF